MHAAPLTALRAAVAAAVLVLFVSLGAAPAAADPPDAVTSQLTDTAEVLNATETSDVGAAQSDLEAAASLRLYVVYVDSFDGTDPVSWATQTATATGLGTSDLLLAVAVTDRQYAFVASNSSPVSASDQAQIRTDMIEPQLGADDWAGAAIDTAQALEDTNSGSSGTSDSSGSSGSGVSSLLTVFLVGLVAIGGFLVFRSMRARSKPAQPGGPAGEPAPVDTATLDRQASAALVMLDDELRSSEQELGFAQAQFGDAETRTFTTVLADAKAAGLRAFGLRQLLDDSEPETEDQRRAMLIEILRLCTQADAALDEQKDSFDALRDLQTRAPELLEATDRRAAEASEKVVTATQTLARLGATYPASSLTSVSTNPEHASGLLDAARESVVQGRAAVTAGDLAAA